tara:strand:- start:1244 stop:1417 length:174 start_codon:yes stop_codon:yes gene_type:complete
MDIIQALLSVLENPFAEKPYRNCIKWLDANKRKQEADAFRKLINADSPDNEEQSEDN